MPEITNTTPDQFINIDAVCKMFGISRATVYRDIDAKRLPKPIKIGRRSRWSRNELHEIQERIKTENAAA